MRASSTPSVFSEETVALCQDLLPQVSRTFALTIPSLREPVQSQVALSYLLFRLIDCVEDHPELDEPERNRLLAILAAWSADPLDQGLRDRFERGCPPHPSAAYERVLRAASALLAAREEFDTIARRAVDDCWYEMIAGMAMFPGRHPGRPVAVCAGIADLERYCHVVAGVVGILLTRLFAPMLEESWLDDDRRSDGRRFGIGLQLTNVLKDHAADRDRGVCYVPTQFLEGGEPGAPFTASGLARVAVRTLDHLAAGHRYILSISAERDDLRLFCLGAHHLALATVAAACDPAGPRSPKISREEVGAIWSACREASRDNLRADGLYTALAERARVKVAALQPTAG